MLGQCAEDAFEAPLRGGEASVWSADPALAPDQFLGTNGLEVHDGAVWASNSDRGTIVRVGADGTRTTLLNAEDGMQGTTAVVVRGDQAHVTNGANLAGNGSNLLVAELRRR